MLHADTGAVELWQNRLFDRNIGAIGARSGLPKSETERLLIQISFSSTRRERFRYAGQWWRI